MFRKYYRIFQRKKFYRDNGICQHRSSSSSSQPRVDTSRAHCFGDFVAYRQREALRSIVFQVPSVESYDDLKKHCSQFGSVNKAYFYEGRKNDNLLLVEFEEKEAADEVMKTHQFCGTEYSPRSRYPVFDLKQLKAPPLLNQSARTVDLNTDSGKKRLQSATVYDLLLQAETVDDQINTLFHLTSLNDLHTRLRFLAVVQIEDAIRSVSPGARAYPFGSSANGFGRQLSDLDFVVTNHSLTISSITGIMEFLPGVTNMSPLSNASVPIIKYDQSFLNLEADLSLDQLRYVYATEILYCCGQLDTRLRPLIFSLRWWADRMGVTKSKTGPWIRNYGLNLLTIFYMQQLEKPIMPPLVEIANLDREKAPDSEAHFIKDFRQLNFRTTNANSLADLIIGFMKFYADFDFGKFVIDIESGKVREKSDSSQIDIINLLGTDNVATNVNYRYAKILRKAFSITSMLDFDLASEVKRDNETWGLVQYFKMCDAARYRQRKGV